MIKIFNSSRMYNYDFKLQVGEVECIDAQVTFLYVTLKYNVTCSLKDFFCF